MAARSDEVTESLLSPTSKKTFFERIEPNSELPYSEFPHVGVLLEDEFFKEADDAEFTRILAIIESKAKYVNWKSKGNFNQFPDKFERLLKCIANSKQLLKFSTNAYEFMSQPHLFR